MIGPVRRYDQGCVTRHSTASCALFSHSATSTFIFPFSLFFIFLVAFVHIVFCIVGRLLLPVCCCHSSPSRSPDYPVQLALRCRGRLLFSLKLKRRMSTLVYLARILLYRLCYRPKATVRCQRLTGSGPNALLLRPMRQYVVAASSLALLADCISPSGAKSVKERRRQPV